MKRILFSTAAFLLSIILFSTTAFSVSGDTNQSASQNSSIKIQEGNNIDLSDPNVKLPIDVIYLPEQLEIRKIYELKADADPGFIPHDEFVRNNILYKCSDILREEVVAEDKKSFTETETVSSGSKDMDVILGLLPQSKEVETEDGYRGILELDVASIKTEVSGYGSKTNTKTITRDYPNLSDADLSFIPKTIEENGITYTFQNVDWQSDNWANVDDYEISNRYKAHVTYSGSSTSSYVKGYVTTANYTGEISKSDISVIRYTVIFTESEAVSDKSKDNGEKGNPFDISPKDVWLFIIVLLVIVAALASIMFILATYKKRRETMNSEETYEYDYSEDYENDNDPGDGDDSGYTTSDDGDDV